MKTSTARQLEKITEDYIRENFKFVKIQGEPSRLKLRELEEEMSVAATSVECDYYEWAEDHGCLAYVIGVDRYEALTGLEFEEPSRPTRTHPDIDDNTSLEERADLKAENDENLESWYTLQGALKGLTANLRDAIDPKYYQELKKPLLGYKKVTIREYIEHIKKEWCVLDTEETRRIKLNYFRGWNEEAEEEALAMFGKRLDDEQEELAEDNIIVTSADKLQHYMEQMYASEIFEQRNYDDWEDLDEEDKTWDNATDTFENYVKKQRKYNRNKRGSTAKRAKYESAAQVQEQGQQQQHQQQRQQESDDGQLQHFLQQVTQTNSGMVDMNTKLQEQMAQQSAQIDKLLQQAADATKQILQLAEQNSKLAKARSNNSRPPKEEKPEKQGRPPKRQTERDDNWKRTKYPECTTIDWDNSTRDMAIRGMCNIGGYCWTCGFDPMGRYHGGRQCKNKAAGHKDKATKTNRMGGSVENKPTHVQL